LDTQKHIDEVMDHFDFEKVHKVMVAIDWHWATSEDGGTPYPYEIRKTARSLLKDAAAGDDGSTVATGGLVAERLTYENYSYLTLAFHLTQADSSYAIPEEDWRTI